jgi:hypothetical protein
MPPVTDSASPTTVTPGTVCRSARRRLRTCNASSIRKTFIAHHHVCSRFDDGSMQTEAARNHRRVLKDRSANRPQ